MDALIQHRAYELEPDTIPKIAPLPINLTGKPLNSDMTAVFFDRQGDRTEHQRYYYIPNGDGVRRERAVIACTESSKVGPFTMTRTVTYGAWELDPSDNRRDERRTTP